MKAAGKSARKAGLSRPVADWNKANKKMKTGLSRRAADWNKAAGKLYKAAGKLFK